MRMFIKIACISTASVFVLCASCWAGTPASVRITTDLETNSNGTEAYMGAPTNWTAHGTFTANSKNAPKDHGEWVIDAPSYLWSYTPPTDGSSLEPRTSASTIFTLSKKDAWRTYYTIFVTVFYSETNIVTGETRSLPSCHASIGVITFVVASIKSDRTFVSADTLWPGLALSATRANIKVITQPAGFEDLVSLKITSVTPNIPATGNGILTRNTDLPDGWTYGSFVEDQSIKHPVRKKVTISASFGDQTGIITLIWVVPVFDYLKLQLPPAGYNDAWQYVKWKYGISTSHLNCIAYDSTLGTAGLTAGQDCKLGSSAFDSENLCASVLLHENVHGGQLAASRNASFLSWTLGGSHWAEVDAYQAEIDAAQQTGLTDAEIADVTAWRNYYNRTGSQPE